MKKDRNLMLSITLITFCLVISSCINSENAKNIATDPDFNFDDCPKAWSIEELKTGLDSFCIVALLGNGQKLTEFPEVLSKMPYLRSIDVSRNRIEHIPKYLSKLEELDLGSNMLDECPTGLKNVKNLIILKLSNNSIRNIDKAIFDMTNLEELWMYNNLLTEIPTQLCSLTNIRILSFNGNDLNTIPAEIGQLVNLEELYLSDQEIESLPEELGHLKRLTTLHIGSNYSGGGISNTFENIPSCIFELETLKILSLSYGNITEIPSDIERLSNIETLDLSGNELTSLPEELKNLKKLKYLFLGGNSFSKEEENKIRSWFGDDVFIQFEEEMGG